MSKYVQLAGGAGPGGESQESLVTLVLKADWGGLLSGGRGVRWEGGLSCYRCCAGRLKIVALSHPPCLHLSQEPPSPPPSPPWPSALASCRAQHAGQAGRPPVLSCHAVSAGACGDERGDSAGQDGAGQIRGQVGGCERGGGGQEGWRRAERPCSLFCHCWRERRKTFCTALPCPPVASATPTRCLLLVCCFCLPLLLAAGRCR